MCSYQMKINDIRCDRLLPCLCLLVRAIWFQVDIEYGFVIKAGVKRKEWKEECKEREIKEGELKNDNGICYE